MSKSEAIKVGVGAVVFRGEEVLLIKRGKAPFKGAWSIPGGGLDYGESVKDAVLREVMEETSLEVEILALLDVFDGLPDTHPREFSNHIVMIDYVCEWRAGDPVAGDDAVEAEFVSLKTAQERLSWDKTREALARAREIYEALRAAP